MHRLARLLLILTSAFTAASAIPVFPPVQRTLTDEFERTTDARIVGVTTDSLEIVRVADNARFTLALSRLSQDDRLFAAHLLETIEASRPLPDTECIKAIRRDFQAYDAGKKRLVPLAANAYAGDRILVVAFNRLRDAETVFTSNTANTASVSGATPDAAPVLWIFTSGEPVLFELAGDKLPAGHAMISHAAREKAVKRAAPIRSETVSAWVKRNLPDLQSNRSFQILLSDAERDDMNAKLAKVMPPYWADPSAGVFNGMKTYKRFPAFHAIHRSGAPVKFRGVPLSGTREIVMKTLRENASELE